MTSLNNLKDFSGKSIAVHQYPKDLAKVVIEYLRSGGMTSLKEEIITRTFEIMYFASIKTEEADSIVFNIMFLDENSKKDLVEFRGHGIVESQLVIFEENLEFNIKNLIKLARASDPRSSSIAVFTDESEKLLILGFIDQDNGFHHFVNFESEESPNRPGIFQACLVGPGNIVAFSGKVKIAELIVNRIVKNEIDVFSDGPILNKCHSGLKSYLSSVKRKVGGEDVFCFIEMEEYYTKYWFSTICRLILRIKSYGHGGAILISNSGTKGLNVKYNMQYNRLRLSIIDKAVYLPEAMIANSQIKEHLDLHNDIPFETYEKEKLAEKRLSKISSEIDASLWFISLLSRVDGLILMNKRLDVKGFGAEIRAQKEPQNIYSCSSSNPDHSENRKVDYDHFGTRHRSMIRYCNTYPDSVGIVVSQDGDVRAMTRLNDDLLIWENIKLQAYTLPKTKTMVSNYLEQSWRPF